jgi:hypothetical protein
MQKATNLLPQGLPEVVGEALLALALAALHRVATTLRGIDGFVNGADDFIDRDVTSRSALTITAARTAYTIHQALLAQAPKKLLQVGNRNLLTAGNVGNGDHLVLGM